MTIQKPALLQLLPFSIPEAGDRLRAHFDVIEAWTSPDRETAISGRENDILAMTTSALTTTPAALIDRMPNLRAICSFGVGYDSIDVKHAQQKGIQVSNTPDILNDCVADIAFGLLLAAARRLGHGDRYVRDGLWGGDTAFPLGVRASGKKLGIVGLGRIGAAIARRASGFDMDVRYHNRNPRPDSSLVYEPSLRDLARWSDFLVIATVGGPSTRHMINKEVLEALGPKGIIVNIARGSVIDEAALVDALVAGRLGGAGLDVYEDEPRVPDALKALDNVVLVPHIASATAETRRAMAELVLKNVEAFATQGTVLTAVPPL